MKLFANPYASLGIFTIFLALVVAILERVVHLPYVHEYVWYILLFFFLQSLFTTFITHRGLSGQKEDFTMFYFGAMTVRMLISILAAVLVIFNTNTNKYHFVGNFFVLYFAYIMFEIYSLLSNLRAHSKGNN